jgi:hypothetical protein
MFLIMRMLLTHVQSRMLLTHVQSRMLLTHVQSRMLLTHVQSRMLLTHVEGLPPDGYAVYGPKRVPRSDAAVFVCG